MLPETIAERIKKSAVRGRFKGVLRQNACKGTLGGCRKRALLRTPL